MEETVILNFEVDQGKAESQLKKVEGLILDNRKAQQELTKAYKQGTITQDEYIDENIRLQQNLKKEQEQKKTLTKLLETESNSRNAIRQRVSALVKEYDNLNTSTATGIKRADQLEKELAQLNAQLNKGDKAAGLFKNQIGNYPQQFADAAKNINVAGVSVGSLTSNFAAFANPAGAALGIVTGLVSAYASSTRGAKDLEFAQNQLAAAFSIANNEFAKFISSSDEDGEGFFSRLSKSFIENTVGSSNAIIAELSAKNIERLEDLERKELEVKAIASDRIEQNQEQLEITAKELNTRQAILDAIAATSVIDKNLNDNKKEVLAVLNEQLNALEFQKGLTDNDEAVQTLIAQKVREISKEETNIQKQLTRNNKLRDDLNAKLAKEIELRRQAAAAELELFRLDIREANKPGTSSLTGQNVLDPFKLEASGENSDLTGDIIQASKDRQAQFLSELKTVEFTEKQKREFYIETAEIQQQIDRQTFQAALDFAAGLAGLFQEQTAAYKVFASAETILSTYSAATKAYEAAFTPPTAASPALGAAYAGLAIANGLANLAKINGVEFAEGGWTGPGDKYDVAGLVHADEYVVPKNVNNSPAAQPHLAALERMRGGYADGGFVANRNTAPAQQALLMANALKNLPAPVVSVVEVTRQQNRVQARERVSTLRP